MPDNQTQTWVWRGLRLELPPDWEMLQFACNPKEGRCAFADRYRYRFELNWRRVEGPPDFERMLSDYKAKLRSEGHEPGQNLTYGAWQGFRNEAETETSSRFGRYLPELKYVAETVFLWPDNPDPELERRILLDAAADRGSKDGHVHWQVFGMDVQADAALDLRKCAVHPGQVELKFADERGRRTQRFARRAFVDQWLHQPLDSWLREWVGRETETREARVRDCRGHSVAACTGISRRKGVFRRSKPSHAAAWICPSDGRLYSVDSTGCGGTSAGLERAWELPGAAMTCCPRLTAQ